MIENRTWLAANRSPPTRPWNSASPLEPATNELGSGAEASGLKASKGRRRSTPGQSGCTESGSVVCQKIEYNPFGIRPRNEMRTSVRRPSGPPTVDARDVAVAADHSPQVTGSPGAVA